MESGKGAAAVFLAFDSVPYKALIEKTASHWPGPCAMDYQLPHKPYIYAVCCSDWCCFKVSSCHFLCATGVCPGSPSFPSFTPMQLLSCHYHLRASW